MSRKRRQTVSLVLGSGGARGLAHIGVIQWLEEQGYRIESISGASMGALVGGIHAAGKLDSYRDWVCALRRTDVVRFLDLAFQSQGLFKGDRIIETLRRMVGEHRIEDLPIAFTAVATDIDRRREVWISSWRRTDSACIARSDSCWSGGRPSISRSRRAYSAS